MMFRSTMIVVVLALFAMSREVAGAAGALPTSPVPGAHAVAPRAAMPASVWRRVGRNKFMQGVSLA